MVFCNNCPWFFWEVTLINLVILLNLELQQFCDIKTAAALGAGVSSRNREHSLMKTRIVKCQNFLQVTFYKSDGNMHLWASQHCMVGITKMSKHSYQEPKDIPFFQNNAAQPTTFSKNSHSLLTVVIWSLTNT